MTNPDETKSSAESAATPPADLERQVMDPCIAKTEREWWAKRRIESLLKERDVHAIKYEVMGGEDVPGSASAVDLDDVKREMERLRRIERRTDEERRAGERHGVAKAIEECARGIADHPSPWFFGPKALCLLYPEPTPFIGATGELGMFAWSPNFANPAAAAKWMRPAAATIEQLTLATQGGQDLFETQGCGG